MRLPTEALQELEEVLHELGYSDELSAATREDLEEFGLFLLELMAAAIKTRQRLRSVGIALPPSEFPEDSDAPIQPSLPGFGD